MQKDALILTEEPNGDRSRQDSQGGAWRDTQLKGLRNSWTQKQNSEVWKVVLNWYRHRTKTTYWNPTTSGEVWWCIKEWVETSIRPEASLGLQLSTPQKYWSFRHIMQWSKWSPR